MTSPLGKSFATGLKSDTQSTKYPKNWAAISNTYRKSHNYECEICGVNCNEHRRLTDAHHINGVKTDCSRKNLKCLCKYHHAELHGRSSEIEEEYLQALRKLWEEQNISPDLRG